MKYRWLQCAIICSLLLILLWVSTLGFNLYRLYYQPMTLGDSLTSVVQLDKSMSATSFAHTLKSQHLIQSERLFLALVRTENLSHRLKAGIYQVKAGETCLQFLNRVVAGDVLIESFQIIEGTTRRQVSENLAKADYLTYNDVDWLAVTAANAHTVFPVKAGIDPQSSIDVQSGKDSRLRGKDTLFSGPIASAEGSLLADTYHYNAGSQAKDLLVRAHTSLQQYLDYSWQHRLQGLPYKTPYELLIAASIIEKETAVPAERHLIAGVIINRLNKHMPLQMDPTVIYALGETYNGKLTHEDMQIDSPYNSYRYRGLPPTPIAMVGKDAIDAAAQPELTDYVYFVARGDGTHQFSVTYDQQKEAIARYLRKSK